NHEQNGVYVLQLDENYTRVVSEEVEPADGFGSSMFKFKGDLFLSSSSGVMKFDYEKLQFATDSTLTNALFVKNDTITSIIISEADKLWGFTNRNIVSLSQGKFDNEPYVTRIPVPSLFRRTLGVTGFECVLKLENEKYLIGSSTGYLTLDMGKLKKANTNIYINSITVSDLKSQSHEVDFLNKTTFLNKENNFQILFSTPNFNQFSETEYQYQLIGIYDQWSDWSRQSNVTFSNLPHGDYTFKVRSRIGNILSENEEIYSFSIDKPWYLSNLAWVIY
ncbi:MAG: two component regulator three y domain-containing protein, partial [Mangrovimonas sp.]|nr:two component regulator three y domain-containing protein [Mangrovimonas sp.]